MGNFDDLFDDAVLEALRFAEQLKQSQEEKEAEKKQDYISLPPQKKKNEAKSLNSDLDIEEDFLSKNMEERVETSEYKKTETVSETSDYGKTEEVAGALDEDGLGEKSEDLYEDQGEYEDQEEYENQDLYENQGEYEDRDLYEDQEEYDEDDEEENYQEDEKNRKRKNKKKKKKKVNDILWTFVFFIALIVFFITLFIIIRYILSEYKNRKAMDEIKATTEQPYTYNPQKDSMEEGDSPAKLPVNFSSLQADNSEIYAWIYIPNTNINYPILQSGIDNSYYLSHDVSGEESFDGSIYTENYNTKDFTDFNTVIYGHNMKSGTMFRTLHNFEKKDFCDANRFVYIYTPYSILTYEVFAAYTYDDRHILNSFDFSQDKVKDAYIKSIFDSKNLSAVIYDDVTVDVDSRIVTLSTCCGDDEKRWIVQAVLVDEVEAE